MTDHPVQKQPSLTESALQTDAARALVAHWSGLFSGGDIPLKSAVRPEELKAVLPWILIYEYLSRDDIRIRLCGTATYSAYKRNLTGENYLDLVPASYREGASRRLHAIIQQPCALVTSLSGPAGLDVKGLYEVIGLPLKAADGETRFSIHSCALIERGERGSSVGRKKLESLEALYVDIGFGLPAQPPG